MIIGIAGKMGAGKDVVGLALKGHFPDLEIRTFSAKLKSIASDLFDVNGKSERARYVYQNLGDKMREIDPLVWIKYTLDRMYDYGFYLITGVRYVNEAQTILDRGGVVFVLDACSETRKWRCEHREDRIIPDEEWNKAGEHTSERSVDDILLINHPSLHRIDAEPPIDVVLNSIINLMVDKD